MVFGGYEIKQNCPLLVRRRLAGHHQIQTTAGLASTTLERISVLLDRLQDAEGQDQTLVFHVAVKLEECGVTAEESALVCFDCRFYRFWPVSMPLLNFFNTSLILFLLQSNVAKTWFGVGWLVNYVGADAVGTMAANEKRGLYPALGAFKEVEGIMPDRLSEIVGYMDGTKSTLPGLKKIITI